MKRIDDIVNAVFDKRSYVEPLECIIEKMKNSSTDEYAYERILINHLVYTQTVYWQKHGLEVIWSSHDELYNDLKYLCTYE